VVYRKGELSPAAVDRDWPHQVALRAEQAARDFQVIAEFCRELSLCVRGHSVNDGKDWYRIYRFAKPGDATAFMARFGGESFDPRRRGRGARWPLWKR
jgi:hypothetical protein